MTHRQRLLLVLEIECVCDTIGHDSIGNHQEESIDEHNKQCRVDVQVSWLAFWDVGAVEFLLEELGAQRGKDCQPANEPKENRNRANARVEEDGQRAWKRLHNKAKLVESNSVHHQLRFQRIRLDPCRKEDKGKEQRNDQNHGWKRTAC